MAGSYALLLFPGPGELPFHRPPIRHHMESSLLGIFRARVAGAMVRRNFLTARGPPTPGVRRALEHKIYDI